MTMNHSNSTHYVSFFRRFFAIFYDGLLLLAILFIITAIANLLNQGVAIKPSDNFYPLYVFTVIGLSYFYFAWFWIHGGQTLGMKTWQIQLQANNPNKTIDYLRCAIRFFCAALSWSLLGLGFVWAIFDKKKRSFHDLVSQTILIDLR